MTTPKPINQLSPEEPPMSTEQPTPETDAVINGIRERSKPYTVYIYTEMVDKMKSLELQRDTLRAEVARLTGERDEATEELIRVCHALECTAQEARSISSRADSIMRSWKEAKVEIVKRDERIASLVESWNDEHVELATLRATRDADHATIDAAAAACSDDLGLTSAKGIIVTHMRTLGGPQVDHGAAIEATMHDAAMQPASAPGKEETT